MAYNQEKFDAEVEIRTTRISPEYPILFNRINWEMIEENMDELCDFQRKHDDILPPILFYATDYGKKYIQ